MGAGHEQVLDRVLVLRLGALEPLAAAPLRAVLGDRRPFDVAVRADRDDHCLFFDQVFQVDVAELVAADLGAPLVGVLSFHLLEVLADDRADVLLVGEDPPILADVRQQVAVLVAELLLFEIDQLAQGHAEDGVGLDRSERIIFGRSALLLKDREPALAEGASEHRRRALDLHQAILGLGLRLRRPDHPDDFVDIRVGQEQAFDGVLPLPGLGQQELRPAADHRDPMAEEFLQNPLEGENSRLAVDKGQEDQRERVL